MPSVFEVESVREAAEVLSRASAEGMRVSIDRPGGDVVVSMTRLNQVLEHEAGDLTCTVEAGVRLSDLSARLAEDGQMLALDPPGDPTIGACIAGNLSGPRRHRYGTARDLVLGVTVVLGDGTIASSGGNPQTLAEWAHTYPAVPRNIACPKESSPPKPISRLNAHANNAKHSAFIRNTG